MGKMNEEQQQLFDQIRSEVKNGNGYAKAAEILKQDFQTRNNPQNLQEIHAFYKDIARNMPSTYGKDNIFIQNIFFAACDVTNFSRQFVNGSSGDMVQIFGTERIKIADDKLLSFENALLQYQLAKTLCEYGALSNIDFQESIATLNQEIKQLDMQDSLEKYKQWKCFNMRKIADDYESRFTKIITYEAKVKTFEQKMSSHSNRSNRHNPYARAGNPSTFGDLERKDRDHEGRSETLSRSSSEESLSSQSSVESTDTASKDLTSKMEELAVELPKDQKETDLKTDPNTNNPPAYTPSGPCPTYEEATANDQKKTPTDPPQESEQKNPGCWEALKSKLSRKRRNSDDVEQGAEALPEKFRAMKLVDKHHLVPEKRSKCSIM